MRPCSPCSRIRRATLSASTVKTTFTSVSSTRSRGVVVELPTLLTAALASMCCTGEVSSPGKGTEHQPVLAQQTLQKSDRAAANSPMV